MKKALLTGISDILPFDDTYVKVGAGRGTRWNLMDAEGKLVSDTWFSDIRRNSDGSVSVVPTGRRAVPIKFQNVPAMGRASAVVKAIPPEALRQLDPATVTLDPHGKFVARGKLYGKDVDITASGEIFLPGVGQIRALIGEVDGRRLGDAVWSVNRKLHREAKPHDPDDSKVTTYEGAFKRKITLWAFWFAVGNHSVTTELGRNLVMHDNSADRWTDDIIVRLMYDYNGTRLVSPDDVKRLNALIGNGNEGYAKLNGGGKVWNVTWHIGPGDVDRVISALNTFASRD